MRVIGIGTSVLGTAVAVVAAVVLVRSIPDIKRYLKIRAM
jgi:uncharacterized protein DUF6893